MSRFLSKFVAGAAGAGVGLMDTAIKEQMLKAREKRMAALEEQRHKRDRAEQLADHKRDREEKLADFELEQNARQKALQAEYAMRRKLQREKAKAEASKEKSRRIKTVKGADGRLYRVNESTGEASLVYVRRTPTPEEVRKIQQQEYAEIAAVAPGVVAPVNQQPVPKALSVPLTVPTDQNKPMVRNVSPDGVASIPAYIDLSRLTYTPLTPNLKANQLTRLK